MGDEEKKEKKKKSKKKVEEPAPPPAEEQAPPEESKEITEPEAEPPPEQEPEEEPPPPVIEPPPAKPKKKLQRTTSSILTMFSKRKVEEFKEAFQFIDQNKDGFLTKDDIRGTFESLGKEVEDEDLETMVAEAPGPINFTMFLTIFGDRIAGTDDDDVILNAFRRWDHEGEGRIKHDVLKHALMSWGEKYPEEEAEEALHEAPVDPHGYIDIKRFTRIITKGEDEESAA